MDGKPNSLGAVSPTRPRMVKFTPAMLDEIERAMQKQGARNFSEWVRVQLIAAARQILAT